MGDIKGDTKSLDYSSNDDQKVQKCSRGSQPSEGAHQSTPSSREPRLQGS